MAKRNDGNEQDLRVRPALDAHPLTDNNPYDGETCEDKGEQVDLPIPPVPPQPPVPPEPPGPPGPDVNPSYDWSSLAGLCPGGFEGRSMDQLLSKILKAHFSDPDNIVNPTLKSYVYSPIPNQTKIRIVMNTNFDTTQAGLFPAIVIKRGQQKLSRIVMGDRAVTGGWPEGILKYARMQQGSHKILAMATADGVTEDLANEIYNLLNCLTPVLMSIGLPLQDFQVTDLSELGIIEDLGQTFGVTTVVSYAYEYGWTVRYNGPTLRAVTFPSDVTLSVQDAPPDVNLRTC